MLAVDEGSAFAAIGVAETSVFVAAALVFVLAYLDLVEPSSLDEEVRLGLRAMSLSLFVVFVAIVLVRV